MHTNIWVFLVAILSLNGAVFANEEGEEIKTENSILATDVETTEETKPQDTLLSASEEGDKTTDVDSFACSSTGEEQPKEEDSLLSCGTEKEGDSTSQLIG